MQDRREIGLYPLCVVYAFSGLLGLGMVVTSALLKGREWYSNRRHPLNSSMVYCLIAG
jgi:hypothetical protein